MLTILSVAYPFAVVGPEALGGAEQVLTSVERTLVARGHQSIVVARERSQPAGHLVATPVPDGVIDDRMRERVTRAHQDNIDFCLRAFAVDVVHMHGIDFQRYTLPPSMPVLVTLHLPPSWYPEEIWSLPSNYQLQCVSATQRSACPAMAQERLFVVENGVAIPDRKDWPKRRGYALMLSRICPEKNLHAGLDAAEMAGVPVLLAGETFPYEAHLRYAREQIEPRLGEGARFLGGVFGAAKTKLIARARCLLLPTVAPETSSLVAMEAIALGTPVVAFRSGALPEIVEDGVTGFLVEDTLEMSEAITRAEEIRPSVCRAVAANRFAETRMVDAYIDCYRRMLRHLKERIGNTSSSLTRAVEQGAATPTVAATLVRTLRELEELAPAWQRLWRAERGATPFQNPEWLIPWWKHVGQGELCVVALSENDADLVGLLPLYVYTQPVSGERHLLLLGAGTSDYLDGLFRASRSSDVNGLVDLAMQAVQQQRTLWDRCILHQLRSDSPLLRWARGQEQSTFESEACSYVPVDGWAQLPGKIRANSKRYRRRAEALGALSFRVATTTVEAMAEFEKLLTLQTKRWKERGEPGVLAPNAVQMHHRESIARLQEAGLLRMFSLALDGEVIAVLYAMVNSPQRSECEAGDRRLFCYLISFDTAYAEISPGTLLLSYAFDTCGAERIRVLDLLRGGEGYKELWGATAEATYGFTL